VNDNPAGVVPTDTCTVAAVTLTVFDPVALLYVAELFESGV